MRNCIDDRLFPITLDVYWKKNPDNLIDAITPNNRL